MKEVVNAFVPSASARSLDPRATGRRPDGSGFSRLGRRTPPDPGNNEATTPSPAVLAKDARPGPVQDGPQAHDAVGGWLVPARGGRSHVVALKVAGSSPLGHPKVEACRPEPIAIQSRRPGNYRQLRLPAAADLRPVPAGLVEPSPRLSALLATPRACSSGHRMAGLQRAPQAPTPAKSRRGGSTPRATASGLDAHRSDGSFGTVIGGWGLIPSELTIAARNGCRVADQPPAHTDRVRPDQRDPGAHRKDREPGDPAQREHAVGRDARRGAPDRGRPRSVPRAARPRAGEGAPGRAVGAPPARRLRRRRARLPGTGLHVRGARLRRGSIGAVRRRRPQLGQPVDPREVRHGTAEAALAAPADRRHDAVGLLHDRARPARVRPPGAEDHRTPRWRYVGHQRPQVVHVERQAGRLPHRHVPHRGRGRWRRPQRRHDPDHRAHRHAGREHRARHQRVGSGERPLRGHLRRCARAARERSGRAGRATRPPRTGSVRAACTTA